MGDPIWSGRSAADAPGFVLLTSVAFSTVKGNPVDHDPASFSCEQLAQQTLKALDALDVNKDGELDVKELTGMRFAPKTGGTTR